MTSLLLDALAGLGMARREALGRYALAIDLPPLLRALIRSWSQLSVVVRNGKPLVRTDTLVGASDLYLDCLPVLSAMFAPAASRAAQLLASRGTDVLDVGADAAPWSIALANVCQLFDETDNRALLRRLHSALRPRELVAVIDVLTSRDPAEQRSISLYPLDLRLRTSSGAVHPIAAYEPWTNDAEFGLVHVDPLSAEPSPTLLTCRTI